MDGKKALATIERAEKAGIRIVIDADEWYSNPGNPAKVRKDFPLDLAVSPYRCELVAEARRLAEAVASRPAQPPEGQVYRHSAATYEAAVQRAARHIESVMKESQNGKQDNDPAPRAEQRDVPGKGVHDSGGGQRGSAPPEDGAGG